MSQPSVGSRGRFVVGIGPKLVLTIVTLVVFVALLVTWVGSSALERNMILAHAAKGEAIALSLAAAVEQASASGASAQAPLDASRRISSVRYIFILDREGGVQAHTFSSLPADLAATNPILKADLSNKRVRVAEDVTVQDGNQTYEVIDIAKPTSSGVVHVGLDRVAIREEVSSVRLRMIGLGAAVALGGSAVALIFIFLWVVRPVRELTRVTREIVTRGDLSQTIEVHSEDEIGQLAGSFSLMVEKLRQIPTHLTESAQRLSQAVHNLAQSTTQQSETVTRQAAALQQTQVTAQEIKQTSLVAAQKAEVVLRVAERADEIGRAGEAAIEQSLSGLTDIRSQVEEINKKIAELGEKTRQIGGITSTVKDLADQSNMLALNAAIEAVRSGEHGKGFAVVAREIRSLADQSIQATNRVREILEDIGSAIAKAVSIAERGAQKMEAGLAQVRTSGDSLRELSGIVQDNSAAVRQIAAAVNQQNAGISQIFTAVTELSRMMDETVRGIQSTTEAAGVLKDVSTKVSDVVSTYRV